jgi:hypothetical protein
VRALLLVLAVLAAPLSAQQYGINAAIVKHSIAVGATMNEWTVQSWRTELLIGAGGAIVASVVLRSPILALVIATVASVIYEKWFDQNGWSWPDVFQREIGIIIGIPLAGLIPGLFQ